MAAVESAKTGLAQGTRTELPTLPHSPGAGMNDDWFVNLYKGKQMVPWDHGKEQEFVVQAFEQGLLAAPVIDVGCGLGPNAIFLGSRGVEVTGIDLSPEAIAEAEKRLSAAGPPATEKVSFKAGSVLDLTEIFGEHKFASALDSALYHCLDDDMQSKYLAALHKQMTPGGRLVLCAMSDKNPAEGWVGPRRISEAAIRHSLREEVGWRFESINMNVHYQGAQGIEALNNPHFKKGAAWALLAVATRI